ncbi:Dehydrogenase/reductase SDR family member on chromosome X, partial [Camelus dromedarius]
MADLDQFLPPKEVVFGTPSAARLLSPLDDLLRLISETKDLGSGYSAHGAYAQSKLALVLFTYRLQALLAGAGSHVTANVADPGVVNTDLYRHVFWGTGLMKKIFGWWFSK